MFRRTSGTELDQLFNHASDVVIRQLTYLGSNDTIIYRLPGRKHLNRRQQRSILTAVRSCSAETFQGYVRLAQTGSLWRGYQKTLIVVVDKETSCSV